MTELGQPEEFFYQKGGGYTYQKGGVHVSKGGYEYQYPNNIVPPYFRPHNQKPQKKKKETEWGS